MLIKRRIINILRRGDLKISKLARKNKLVAFFVVHIVRIYDFFNDGRVRKYTDDAIKIFLSDETRQDKKYVKKLIKDIESCRDIYLINQDEYFLYGFENLSSEERHEFVGNREKELLCAKLNNNDAWKIFMDKWATYEKFSNYYGRKAILIRNIEEKAYFIDFCEKYKKVIVKDCNSSQGRGIFIVNATSAREIEENFAKVLELLKNETSVIVEECIEQNYEMGKFHPSSVNTVRIATFIKDNDIKVLFSFFKMGRNNSDVDNAGAGGILASVDSVNGKIISDGFSEVGEIYKYHPNTNIIIKGNCMPEWNKAIELVKNLAMVVPEQIYVGWDLAYTDTGWIMIEGNSWGQFICPQIALKKGIRPIIEDTFYQCI